MSRILTELEGFQPEDPTTPRRSVPRADEGVPDWYAEAPREHDEEIAHIEADIDQEEANGGDPLWWRHD